MRDPNYPLKQTYFKLLNGKVSYKGIVVNIYDSVVPDNAQVPYIIFSNIVSTISNTTQTNYNWKVAVLLDVVQGYIGGFGGKTDVFLITEKILEILLPGKPCDPKPFNLAPFFKVVITKVLSQTSMDNMNETMHIVRNLVRVEHTIEQEN